MALLASEYLEEPMDYQSTLSYGFTAASMGNTTSIWFSAADNINTDNNTNNSAIGDTVNLGEYPDFSQIPALRKAFIMAYVCIIVLTVLGNGLVVYMVLCQRKMQNSVNYLICNLAVSDILVGAFVAPVKLLELVAPAGLQLLSSPLCTALSFTQSVAIFSTIMTLLVISIERFFVIVYPLYSRRFSNKYRTKIYIIMTWILASAISVPNLLGSTQVSYSLYSNYGALHVSICVDIYDSVHPNFRRGYFLLLFIVVYCLPMVIIIITSCTIARTLFKTRGLVCRDLDHASQRQQDNRRKVAAMMIVVSMGFAVCWSPYFFVTVTIEYIHNFFQHSHFFFTMLLINLLGFSNSCINPFIYVMNDRFRENYIRILESMFCLFCIKSGLRSRLHPWRTTQRTTQRTHFSQTSNSSIRRMRAPSVPLEREETLMRRFKDTPHRHSTAANGVGSDRVFRSSFPEKRPLEVPSKVDEEGETVLYFPGKNQENE